MQAICRTEGPVLVLAGAGSGKTRVLTHRAAYLIEEKGVNPYHIMAITFTNKAAGEMRERIDDIVGFGSESIWVSTFHSACVRILRRHINRIGFDTNFTIYDADDQKQLMKDICKRLEIDTKLYKERLFLNAISHAKDELLSPSEYIKHLDDNFVRQKTAQVYTEYQQMLQKNVNPSGGAVGGDYSETMKMAMVVISTLPVIAAYPFMQKYFISGMMLGSVKE